MTVPGEEIELSGVYTGSCLSMGDLGTPEHEAMARSSGFTFEQLRIDRAEYNAREAKKWDAIEREESDDRPEEKALSLP